MPSRKQQLHEELVMAFIRYQARLDEPMNNLSEALLLAQYHSNHHFHAKVQSLTCGVMRIIEPYVELEEPILTKPSIQWDHVHPDYKYLTIDASGKSKLHLLKPKPSDGQWFAIGEPTKFSCVSGLLFESFKPGTCDWKDSLVCRTAPVCEHFAYVDNRCTECGQIDPE